MTTKIIAIYQIINTINGKCYIGSSKNLKNRWKSHLMSLKSNRHHSIYLQRAFNKYGENNFKFSILKEIKDCKNLYELEQYYIDLHNPEYNMCEKAICLNSRKCRKAAINKRAKEYYITLPKGTEILVKNLNKFCKNKKISQSGLYSVIKGQSSHFKNYKARFKEDLEYRYKPKPMPKLTEPHKMKLSKKYHIVYPNGEGKVIINLTKFCKENLLDPSTMINVAKGKCLQHKEFKCYYLDPKKNPIIPKTNLKPKKKYIVTFPDGKEELVSNLRQFCFKYNLSNKYMSQLATGTLGKTHKKFKCRYK